MIVSACGFVIGSSARGASAATLPKAAEGRGLSRTLPPLISTSWSSRRALGPPACSPATGNYLHTPVAGSQVPTGQMVSIKGLHIPAWQFSPVHRLPSLQGVPSSAGGLEHWPVARSHVPATWH